MLLAILVIGSAFLGLHTYVKSPTVAGTNGTDGRLQPLSYHRLSVSGDFLGSSTVQGQMMHPEADRQGQDVLAPMASDRETGPAWEAKSPPRRNFLFSLLDAHWSELSLPWVLQRYAFMSQILTKWLPHYVLDAKKMLMNRTEFEFPFLHGTCVLVVEGRGHTRNNQ